MKATVKIGIGIVVLLLIMVIFGGMTSQTALPNDLKLEKPKYPHIETISDESSGKNVPVPTVVDENNIYQIQYIVSGCSADFDLTVDGKQVGIISLDKCEDLYYSDKGDDKYYVHPQTKTFKLDVDGATRNLNFDFNPTIRNDELTFERFDTTHTVKKPIQSYTFNIVEEVDCTRNSHCSEVVIDGVDTPTYCSINHKCTVESSEAMPPSEEEDANKLWLKDRMYVIIIAIVFLVLMTFAFYRRMWQ